MGAAPSPTDDQGPIVAGAATSVATSAPPTTVAPTTSTSPSTSTSTTLAPAAPASLAVSPASRPGAGGAAVALTVRNGGDEPLSWAAEPSATWLRVSPPAAASTGESRPASPCRRPATASPRATPTPGSSSPLGRPHPNGRGRAAGRASPEISDLAAVADELFTSPCGRAPTTTLVQATVTDESPLSSVTLRWDGQSVPMTQRGGRWFGQLGPVASPGTVSWQVVATDDRGNTASAPGPAVQVIACP